MRTGRIWSSLLDVPGCSPVEKLRNGLNVGCARVFTSDVGGKNSMNRQAAFSPAPAIAAGNGRGVRGRAGGMEWG
jgi:hypothetical protein